MFCNDDDDIIHFMLYCLKVKEFWNSFFLWWNRMSDFRIAYNYEDIEESILFGFQPKGNTFEVLNFCILQAKYYIYIQRMFKDNKVDLYDFLSILKYKLRIEKHTLTESEKCNDFIKYEYIYNSL